MKKHPLPYVLAYTLAALCGALVIVLVKARLDYSRSVKDGVNLQAQVTALQEASKQKDVEYDQLMERFTNVLQRYEKSRGEIEQSPKFQELLASYKLSVSTVYARTKELDDLKAKINFMKSIHQKQ